MLGWGFIWFIELISNLSLRWRKKDGEYSSAFVALVLSLSNENLKFKIVLIQQINEHFLYIFVYFGLILKKCLTDNTDETNLLWK